MSIQLYIIVIVFGGAVLFLGRRFYLQLFRKKNPGCADCGELPVHSPGKKKSEPVTNQK